MSHESKTVTRTHTLVKTQKSPDKMTLQGQGMTLVYRIDDWYNGTKLETHYEDEKERPIIKCPRYNCKGVYALVEAVGPGRFAACNSCKAKDQRLKEWMQEVADYEEKLEHRIAKFISTLRKNGTLKEGAPRKARGTPVLLVHDAGVFTYEDITTDVNALGWTYNLQVDNVVARYRQADLRLTFRISFKDVNPVLRELFNVKPN